jgi:hypothetical protein
MQTWQRRVLGILALGGSFTGLAIGLTLLTSPGNLLSKALALPFLALYVWGIICGLRLIEQREGAPRQNLYFWLVQIPFLTSPIAGYSFSSGSSLYFTYQPGISKWDFLARFGSQFVYSILQTDKPLIIGVNIFAILVCGFLLFLLRRAPPNNSFKPNPLRGSA